MLETGKEWKLPKNVRQIGDGSSEKKIYVEDYVVTFLEKGTADAAPKKAVLFGEVRERELCPYIFVEGALEIESFSMDNAARERLREEMERYFRGKQVVGWFLLSEESPFMANAEVTEIFQREFVGEHQVLIVRDAQERETETYMMEEDHPVRQPGYYVYYEKNPQMQEYMISRNAGKSVETENPVKDDAIRRFRKIIQAKKTLPKLSVSGKAAYAASGFLAVTVLALGATMVYNYGKMTEVERSLAQLTSHVDSQSQYLTDEGEATPVMLHIENEALLEEQTKADGAAATAAEAETDMAKAVQGTSSETQGNNPEQALLENTAAESETSSDAQEVPASAVGRASYTVKLGDTLAGISEMYYGNLEKVSDICMLNGIDDENTILPGQKILLP